MRDRRASPARVASRAVLAAALLAASGLVGCNTGERSASDTTLPADPAAVRVLDAPASPDSADLDLHHRWRAAATRQLLRAKDAPWAFRQFPDLVVLAGEAHRSLLLLPSRDGRPSLAVFRVRVPAGADVDFATWVTIAPAVVQNSDGVDFAVGIGVADVSPDRVALDFERLEPGAARAGWQRVVRDLTPFAGRTVWIVLAARDRGSRVADSLLWGDPRVQSAPVGEAVVDLGAHPGARRRSANVPWSSATIFKTYSLFSDDAVHWVPPEWIRLSFPWLRSLRIFSALGANWGPTLEGHDEDGGPSSSWEAPLAKRYEFFTGVPPAPIGARFSWAEFDRVTGYAAASGLRLHLNLAGAPEAFTGGSGMYRNYHFNERAVVDDAGWRTYVDLLFGHLATQPWFAGATFSFFNEPNCIWTDFDGSVRKVGFQGDAAAYARQYLSTWQAMKPHLGDRRVHLGPWVIEPDAPGRRRDHAAAYIRAIQRTFADAGETLPEWDAFAFNLYETPQLTLDNFASYKLGFVRALLRRTLGPRLLAVNIDEFGVHPIIGETFEKATGVSIYKTRWETSWQAEMLALLVEERVATAASWFPVFMVGAPQALRAYFSYFALSYVMGAIDSAESEGALTAVPAATPGDPAQREVWVKLASRGASRVGYLASFAAGRVRTAIWRYPRFIATDERLATDEGTDVEVRLPPGGRSWRVRILGYEDQLRAPPSAAVERSLGFKAFPAVPRMKEVTLDATGSFELRVGPGEVYLVEATVPDEPVATTR